MNRGGLLNGNQAVTGFSGWPCRRWLRGAVGAHAEDNVGATSSLKSLDTREAAKASSIQSPTKRSKFQR